MNQIVRQAPHLKKTGEEQRPCQATAEKQALRSGSVLKFWAATYSIRILGY